jgi:hypothetical protein
MSLEQEVADGDDDCEYRRAYNRCDENRNQPPEPGKWREQEQRIVGMKAFGAVDSNAFTPVR